MIIPASLKVGDTIGFFSPSSPATPMLTVPLGSTMTIDFDQHKVSVSLALGSIRYTLPLSVVK
jgi:muramoyltetrapeptide carboxypeptidase LdcA involved in peptidoglycan recycling